MSTIDVHPPCTLASSLVIASLEQQIDGDGDRVLWDAIRAVRVDSDRVGVLCRTDGWSYSRSHVFGPRRP